jgi:hypothetical protein
VFEHLALDAVVILRMRGASWNVGSSVMVVMMRIGSIAHFGIGDWMRVVVTMRIGNIAQVGIGDPVRRDFVFIREACPDPWQRA